MVELNLEDLKAKALVTPQYVLEAAITLLKGIDRGRRKRAKDKQLSHTTKHTLATPQASVPATTQPTAERATSAEAAPAIKPVVAGDSRCPATQVEAEQPLPGVTKPPKLDAVVACEKKATSLPVPEQVQEIEDMDYDTIQAHLTPLEREAFEWEVAMEAHSSLPTCLPPTEPQDPDHTGYHPSFGFSPDTDLEPEEFENWFTNIFNQSYLCTHPHFRLPNSSGWYDPSLMAFTWSANIDPCNCDFCEATSTHHTIGLCEEQEQHQPEPDNKTQEQEQELLSRRQKKNRCRSKSPSKK